MATELGQAYVQIMPSSKGISGSIQKAIGGEAEKAGVSAGKSLAGNLVKIATKVITVAGIGKAISASISEGANLQQSLGGIETLFKGSADKVKKYADEAYKTSGLSANDYMQNVTKFSASLLQSLGGDTAKAADTANMAMIDMADNSNKMGTSMESIQDAYKGFAKQNYTMLDNLSLGYGGTKTEMERLLADATKLTGVKYDINNLDDVYNAIHAVQEEMGITGTTAKESAETFSGSFASMSASLKNVIGKLALGESIGPELQALADTTSTFLFDNFIPMVGNILKGLPEMFGTLALEAGKRFSEFLGINLDFSGFSQAIDELLAPFGGKTAVIDALKGAFDNLKSSIGEIASATFGAVGDFLKWLAGPSGEVARALLVGLAAAFVAVKGALILYNTVMTIATAVTTGFTAVMAVLTSPITIVIAAIGALIAVGILLYNNWNTVSAFLKSTWQSISDTAVVVWNSIASFFVGLWNSITAKATASWNSFKAYMSGLWSSISSTTSLVWNSIKGFLSGLWNGVKNTATNIFNGIKNTVTNIWNGIKNTTSNIWNGIKSVISNTINGAKNVVSSVVNGIKGKVSNVWNGIKSTTSSVWNGIKSAMTRPIEAAKNTIRNNVNTVKRLFNFKLSFPKVSIPHIPLPHFSISGSFNPLKGKLPRLGISWYAKGGILTKPTIFGQNGGSLMGGGEAGAEAVLPLNTRNLAGIGKGISDNMEDVSKTQVVINVNNPVVREENDIEKIAKAVSDRFVREIARPKFS